MTNNEVIFILRRARDEIFGDDDPLLSEGEINSIINHLMLLGANNSRLEESLETLDRLRRYLWMPLPQAMNNNLAVLRKIIGLTQVELGVRAGVNSTQIAHYERGNKQPTVQNALRIAEGLGYGVFVEDIWEISNSPDDNDDVWLANA